MRTQAILARAWFILVALLPAAVLLTNESSSVRVHASASDYSLANLTFVSHDGGRVEWSHDGQWIYRDHLEPNGFWDVYRMRPDGTEMQCLTCDHPDLPNLHQGQPAEHPNGRYIVFQTEDPNHFWPKNHNLSTPGAGVWMNLWVLDLQTNRAYQLNQVDLDITPGGSLHPHFSGDGTRLAWGDRQGGAGALGDWRVTVADFVTDPQPHLENTVYYDPGDTPVHWVETGGWTLDDSGLYIACNCLTGQDEANMDIVRLNLADGTWTRLTYTSGLNGEPGEWDEFAHINPAFGDAILWMSSNGYGTQTNNRTFNKIMEWLITEYWLMDPDGSNPTRITYFNDPTHPHYIPGGVGASDLSWSPDGLRTAGFVWIKAETPSEHIAILEFTHGGPTATSTLTSTPTLVSATETPTSTPTSVSATYTPTSTPTPVPATNTPTPTSTPGGAQDTGWLNPAANAADSGGDLDGFEVNPANAHADDVAFAADNDSGTGTSASCTNNKKDKHRFYDYNFSLPGGTTIRGIEVRLDAKVDGTSGSPKMCVQLSWDGGASWTSARSTETLSTSEQTYALGSASDTWGRTWSTSELSNLNFRVRVINVASSTSRDFSLDWVTVNVHYQP